MNNCKGLMGRIFGHRLESFIVYRSGLNGKINIPAGTSEHCAEEVLEKMRELKYEIVCKRCGYHTFVDNRNCK